LLTFGFSGNSTLLVMFCMVIIVMYLSQINIFCFFFFFFCTPRMQSGSGVFCCIWKIWPRLPCCKQRSPSRFISLQHSWRRGQGTVVAFVSQWLRPWVLYNLHILTAFCAQSASRFHMTRFVLNVCVECEHLSHAVPGRRLLRQQVRHWILQPHWRAQAETGPCIVTSFNHSANCT